MLNSFCSHCLVHKNPEEQIHTLLGTGLSLEKDWGEEGQSGTQIMKNISVEETKRAFVGVPHPSAYASKQPVVPQCI